ncbi:hypothetical protein [Amycolatopsis sp. NPDC004169]|uniref:hypothetical protein n=1 Tax=Amycolatopsis sp. NPDC004169 TaxID=3154453 RepID=UPI0033B39BC1
MEQAKYEEDIKRLFREGVELEAALTAEFWPEKKENLLKRFKMEKFPLFSGRYQAWYSEALAVIQQLLPARVDDFVDFYKPRRARKQLDVSNYTISDLLQGVEVSQYGEVVTGPKAAFPKFQQQVRIVQGLQARFESTLYDLKTVLQADLFDHEIDAAGELLKRGFYRAAGALAGVVIESHLSEVARHHGVAMRKKAPTISDFNDSLKQADVIDVATWRKIQYLGDLRNLCSHNKDKEPGIEEASELIEGVSKLVKTIL